MSFQAAIPSITSQRSQVLNLQTLVPSSGRFKAETNILSPCESGVSSEVCKFFRGSILVSECSRQDMWVPVCIFYVIAGKTDRRWELLSLSPVADERYRPDRCSRYLKLSRLTRYLDHLVRWSEQPRLSRAASDLQRLLSLDFGLFCLWPLSLFDLEMITASVRNPQPQIGGLLLFRCGATPLHLSVE